jgi:hypothetical protein
MATWLIGSLHLVLALQDVPQASIVGAVRDEQTGAPLAGAVVALPDLDRVTLADVTGRYRLPAVPAGPQHVAVRFLGYTPRTIHALVPSSGVLEIGVALRPEPLRLRTIEVRPPIALSGLDPDGHEDVSDRALSMAALRNHPLLAEPDALQGLVGGEVVLEPESPSGLHVRGGGSDQVGYLLDGIPVLSPYHSAGLFTGWNPDALAGIRLSAAAPPLEAPAALAGVVTADTRTPGPGHGAQGSLATSQARVTFDGPLGLADAGYLVSLRTGFAGYPVPQGDPSYLRSESGDWLAKVEAPAFGGRVRLLGYENENEVSAAAGLGKPGEPPGRNRFEWGGRSLGLDWRREGEGIGARITLWSAAAAAAAEWNARDGLVALDARRKDLGLLLALEQGPVGARTTMGIRVERRTTRYATVPLAPDAGSWSLAARTLDASGFARHRRALGARATLDAGVALGTGSAGPHFLPRARLTWSPSRRWSLSAGYLLLRQPEQSLRNPESVVGNIFPADLFIGSGAPGIPEARAQQTVVTADYLATRGVRLSAQAYRRTTRDQALVAPRTAEPFARGGVVVGSGSARGIALSASAREARVGVVASYGLQEVRLSWGDSTYVPSHGTTHLLQAGVIVFPSPTLSLRLGAAAAAGRRATTVAGSFEWEACNLLDRGCEFGGSPHLGPEPPGARRLPGYLRLDAGVRQHWHVRVAGRDASVALFGTVTNLIGRRNVLTYAVDPATGQVAPIDMRPLAPLVLGLDWRF